MNSNSDKVLELIKSLHKPETGATAIRGLHDIVSSGYTFGIVPNGIVVRYHSTSSAPDIHELFLSRVAKQCQELGARSEFRGAGRNLELFIRAN